MLPDDDEERFGEDCAVCPWCDHRHEDSQEFFDEVDEYECDKCGKALGITRVYTIEYNTSKVHKKASKK